LLSLEFLKGYVCVSCYLHVDVKERRFCKLREIEAFYT
jgi:hypothetical protein